MNVVNPLPILAKYLTLGWELLPARSSPEGDHPAKSPYLWDGYKGASNDLLRICEWAEQYPGCAWGVKCSHKLAILDLDNRHDGLRLWDDLVAKHEPLLVTPTVRTGGGGFQHYFSVPEGTKGRVLIQVGDNRLVELKVHGMGIIPPSKVNIEEHEGRTYEWEVEPWGVPIAPAPAWLLTANGSGSNSKIQNPSAPANPWVVRDEVAHDLVTHPGVDTSKGEKRRPTLLRLVGVHLARNSDARTIYALASAWAARCVPPLEEHEWIKHVDGLIEKEIGKRQARGLEWTPLLLSEHDHDGQDGEPLASAGQDHGGEHGDDPGDHESGVVNMTATEPWATVVMSATVAAGEQTANELTNSDAGAVASKLVSSQVPDADPVAVDEGYEEAVSSPVLTLHPEARIGLLGEIVTAIEPQLEGAVEPFAFALLAAFGSAVGPGPSVNVGTGGKHRANLSCCVVAPSGVGKSEPWQVASWLMERADPSWHSSCVADGLGSGEGLVDRLKDEQRVRKWNKKAGLVEEEVVPGTTDKRCFVVEAEFGSVLTKARRDGSILGPTLCCSWDGKPLEQLNSGQNKRRATGHHVSVWGNITDAELHKRLSDSIESVNGFGNRFLWLRQERRRYLSRGGNLKVIEPFVGPLADAIARARAIGEVVWDDDAGNVWDDAYVTLCKAQESLPALGRARSQALRLTLLYALLDGSSVIRPEHVRAGLAAWAWCEGSARTIFGRADNSPVAMPVDAEPDPLWLKVHGVILTTSGISRSGIHEAWNNRLKADELDAALDYLEKIKWAERRQVQPEGGGRRAEHWFPVQPGGGDGLDDGEDTHSSLPAHTTDASCELTNKLAPRADVADADGLKGCELTNLLPGTPHEAPSKLVSSQVASASTDASRGKGEKGPVLSSAQAIRSHVEITDVTDADPVADEPLSPDKFLEGVADGGSHYDDFMNGFGPAESES